MVRTILFLSVLFCMVASSCLDRPGPNEGPDWSSSVQTSRDSTKGDTAEAYRELISEMEQPDRIIWQKPDLVISKLGELNGKVVADIGAGTGYFSFRVAQKGANVIAIDIDPKAIAWMEVQKAALPEENQKRLDIRLADADNPRLASAEADMVLMVNTYTYIENRVEYITNLKQGLKPGARIVIIDFKKKSTSIGPASDERLALSTVENELTQAGFSIVDSDDTTLDYQYILTAQMK